MVQDLLTTDKLLKLKNKIEEVASDIKHDSRKVKELKAIMGAQYKTLPGYVQEILNNNDNNIQRLNEKEVYIFSKELHKLTGVAALDPLSYFPPRLAKELEGGRIFAGEEVLTLPYTFKNVIKINEDNYVTSITAKELSELYNSSILQYNYNTQREGRFIKGSLIPVPKTNPKSVEEIKELFKKGDLIVSMFTFNARFGTSDEDEEIEYNPSDLSLTVTKGTLVDVLDGYHRISGVVKAITEAPELDQTFILNILNYTEEKAKRHFAQMNTINPVEKSRIEELGQKRYSSTIVEQLKYNSELKDKISVQSEIGMSSPFLVTYYTLSEAIDDAFEINSRRDAIQLSKYLRDFFAELFYAFPDDFLEDDLSESRNRSYINYNAVFYGYIYLAKKMQENGTPLAKLATILQQVDFDKGKTFKELSSRNYEEQLNAAMKKKLKKVFYDEIDVR
ncbi:hypothetical protein J9345_11615 [Bacillus subtilis subsp. subtilis]|uniref:Uncharacterized protein n=1 Tax=Bacillus subtilis (strain 168) TaxID=224308 RepID=A0A6M3ZBY2_BACSU|nr:MULTISPECIES: DNA sulfur modification protein DndB [Bacillus subtilis group]APD21239.1 hypothetical protein phi3T_96 [Bacillus phage phi3T]MBL3637607.1 hypothetical protein [Alkalicoccobacillus gibsonii]QNN96683.1 hypothetical protein [Bacillus phage phi3Ts]QNN96868.1 hypothetical protein [Bacillus phage Hyb2phi3Ts-SPbeta]QNN97054.1 hypothetical protein [Bacillus phage Hyb3phi3Ts-SPbeta]QNR51587.1 hypothetical protein [Bacillus phage Hyb1phi3Ts-SPbeta]UAW07972.1 hypothetical protein [Baci